MILTYHSGVISAKLEKSRKILVENVSFQLPDGKSMALIGETGSGKTMTALSILGLLPRNVDMQNGYIAFRDQELSCPKAVKSLLGDKIVYIPQNGLEFLNPSRKIRHHLYDNLKRIGISPHALEKTAIEKLRLAGLATPEKLLDQYPFQLSGGMAQRVTIAISACSHAELILADEPTNGLDEPAKQQFMTLLNEVFPQAAKLIITHDIALASLCSEVLVLCKGRMMERGAGRQVLHFPHNGYTKALIASLVQNGMTETPQLRKEYGICPFYPRCPNATEACRREMTYGSDAYCEWWCCNP